MHKLIHIFSNKLPAMTKLCGHNFKSNIISNSATFASIEGADRGMALAGWSSQAPAPASLISNKFTTFMADVIKIMCDKKPKLHFTIIMDNQNSNFMPSSNQVTNGKTTSNYKKIISSGLPSLVMIDGEIKILIPGLKT
jgi:hypothetical protein